ncbi:MAG TPA: hypothetical protein VFE05_21420 [Longimicrobiaceae bacterium]|jgi:hypothetical protein|nr:hypothetical protein [Longimicrobiaceae bacterium]
MRYLVRITCIAGCALLASTRAAAAQAAPNAPKLEWRLGLDLLTSTIRSSAAEGAGTGSRGWGFLLDAGVGSGLVSATADFGMESVHDNRSFSENTTEGYLSSSVTMLLGSVAAGVHTPPVSLGDPRGMKLSAGANVGYTWARADRGIDRCTDCTVEHLGVKGGAFVEPVVNLHRGTTVFNARYRMLQGNADLRSSFSIGVSAPLRGKTKTQDTEEPQADPAGPANKPAVASPPAR